MKTKCDPKLRAELDRISAEIDFEDELAEASEKMEIRELINEARMRGESYGIGFEEGFWAAWHMSIDSDIARSESVRQKHAELEKHWGLGD